jgi:two-component system, LuxR family, sensor kinase FixL
MAVLYAIFSVIWIAGSDQAVAFLFPEQMALAQTFKGWAFVLATTLLLFVLLRSELKRRFRVEAQLRESEKKFRGIAETSPVGIVIVRISDGTILFANSSADRISGFQDGPRSLSGCSIDEINFRATDQTNIRRALLRRERVDNVEGTIRQSGGEERVVLASLQKMNLDGENVLIAAAHDITERIKTAVDLRKLQNELAHASRLTAMGEMAAQFAHELKQPLAAISNYSGGATRILQSDNPRPEDLVSILGRISTQAMRASDIISRIRRFVTKTEGDYEASDLNSLIRESAALLQGDTLAHGAEIRLQLGSSLPSVLGDPVQIQQVIINLARNAIEAAATNTEARPRVVIRTSVRNDRVTVSVKDNGPGIPSQVMGRLFDPFFSTKEGGMGMGLSICRSIVEAHGAQLRVTTAENKGSVFEFELPVADEDFLEEGKRRIPA